MSKSARKIKWDEAVIAEHDKERGTRMKIDEPPTPYHAPTALRDELPFLSLDIATSSVSLLAPPPFRNAKLSPSADAKPAVVSPLVVRESSSKDEEEKSQDANEDHDLSPAEVLERMEEERRRKKFEAARKAHYDEAMRIKQLKKTGAQQEEDEDDE